MSLPVWVMKIPWPLVLSVSSTYGLEPELIAAIMKQESNIERCAVRYEPDFYRRYLSPETIKDQVKENIYLSSKRLKITIETETLLRATSFGFLQVLGQVAREHGFDGHLTELCDPEIGLKYGAIHLKKKLLLYQSIEEAVSAYNAGNVRFQLNGDYSNQKEYVDPVMDYYNLLKKL